MRHITVDAAQWKTVSDLHRDLKERMGFPEYYGNNLDALHDMLTECRDTELTVLGAFSMTAAFGERADAVFSVLMDSAEENPGFRLRLKS